MAAAALMFASSSSSSSASPTLSPSSAANAFDGALPYWNSSGSLSHLDDDNNDQMASSLVLSSDLIQEADGYKQAASSAALQQEQQQQQQQSLAQANANRLNDLDSIVNVTREYPLDYALVMFGYLLPIVMVITIVTNILVVVVLYQKHMRTPTNTVLFTMAIVDLLTLISPSPWYLYIYTFGNHNKFLYPPKICYAYHLMTDVIPVFFHTSSIWLALLLASQRYIYVCHPTLSRTWCTIPRVNRAIFCILTLALAHQFPRFFDNTYESTTIEIKSVQHLACRNSIAKWVETISVPIYYTTYFTFRILFVFIIPCIALLWLNVQLFKALKQAEKNRCQLLATKFKMVDAEPSEAHLLTSTFAGTGGGRGSASSAIYNAPGAPTITATTDYAGNTIIAGATLAPERPCDNASGKVPSDRHTASANLLVRLAETQDADCRAGEGESAAGVLDKELSQAERLSGQESNHQVAACDLIEHSNVSTSAIKCPDHHQLTCWPARGGGGGGGSGPRLSLDEGRSWRSSASRSGASRSSNSSGTSRSSGSSVGVGGGGSGSTKAEHDQHCAECAACERRRDAEENQDEDEERGCTRCSAQTDESGPALPGGASCYGRRSSCAHAHKRAMRHQPVSQCSSILANTVTLDDDMSSSCPGTQADAAGTVTGRPDGTPLDAAALKAASCGGGGGGASAALESDEAADEHTDNAEHELLLMSCDADDGDDNPREEREFPQGRVRTNSGAQARSTPTSKSLKTAGSVESRLACRCLATNSASERTGSRLVHTSRCVGAQNSAGSLVEGATRSSTCSKPARELRSACGGGGGDDDEKDAHEERDRRDTGTPTVGKVVALARQETPRHPGAAQPSATGTTSTTLGSANTNSVGSLLQVQQGSSRGTQSALGTLKAKLMRAKSPSYASCATGRGSRATLLGSCAVPPPIVLCHSQQQQQPGGGRQAAQQSNIQTTNITSSSRSSLDSNKTTLMLIVVVTVFLLVEVPVALVTITHVFINLFDLFKNVDRLITWLEYIKLFTNFFIMISYSVNFTIYCSMSQRFRETFWDLVLCGRGSECSQAKRMLYQSQAAQSQYEPYTQLNQFPTPASTSVPATAQSNFINNNNSEHQYQGIGSNSEPTSAQTVGRNNGRSCDFLIAKFPFNNQRTAHKNSQQASMRARGGGDKCEV